MIPEQVMNVLENGFGRLGSANKQLRPSQCFAKGNYVEKESDEITIYVVKSEAERVIQDYQKNGRIAYFVNMISHKAYQFKGSYKGLKKLDEKDLEKAGKWKAGMTEVMMNFGFPEENINKLLGVSPNQGIILDVELIFNQTPGPNASKEIELQ